MLYSTERDLMSDHDATQPPTAGSPRPDQGDEFNARTVLINQDLLDAARAEQQATGQAPGSAPGAAPGAQAGSWRPVQPDLPAGPPPEEQTRAYSAHAAQAAAQPGAASADPYLQAGSFAQQGGASQPGQPSQRSQFGQPDPAGSAGFGAPASPFPPGQPNAQHAAQPAPYSQPAQPAWGGPAADDGVAAAATAASSPFDQSAPGIPSAPGTSSAPASGAAPGTEASRETLHWQGQQPQAQPAGLQDQQPFAQQPSPHSHPFSGGRQEGDVGMSSVFPAASARAEAEQATEAFAPDATQAVAQSAPSSSAFPSQGSAPQWGSAPSSDAAAGRAPSFPDMAPPASGSPFARPAGGGAPAAARSEESESADSVGSWMLTLFLMAIPVVNLVWLLMLAFGSGHSASKRNWAKASLIWMVIGVVLSFALSFVLGMLGYSLFAVNQSAGVG